MAGKPPPLFVAYVHDEEGRRLAALCRRVFLDAGYDVASDHDLGRRNPISIQAWMWRGIASRVVILVVSEAMLAAITGAEDGAPPRRGIRFEIRAILDKLYYHDGLEDTPVILVAAPSFDVERLPPVLRSLDVHRLDADRPSTIDDLEARVAALGDGHRQIPPGGRWWRPPSGHVPASSRPAYQDLEVVRDPAADEALRLVERCVAGGDGIQLLDVFPAAERIIKAHGAGGLMAHYVQACTDAVGTAPLRPAVAAQHAYLLINGESWRHFRAYRLPAAREVVIRGIKAAEYYHNLVSVALGKRQLGAIERVLAEQAEPDERASHLRASAKHLAEATQLFSLDGIAGNGDELRGCRQLEAWTHLTRHRLLGEQTALAAAEEAYELAAGYITVGQICEFSELRLLEAAIRCAQGRRVEAQRLCAWVIESLPSNRGAQCDEILARALVGRAGCLLAGRGDRASAVRDLGRARKIFLSRDLGFEAADAQWRLLQAKANEVTPLPMSKAQVAELDLEWDPRVRMGVIRELERLAAEHVGRGPAKPRINMAYLIDKVRRQLGLD